MCLKTQNNPKYHPPDGGWGWIIVLAYGLANVLIIPVLQSFGLIFKDKFSDMKMSATQFSLIINISSAFTMSVGLINGPLLNNFGYRKIAIFSGIIFSFGLFITSFANSFTHFIITYSIITSIGTGLATSSFSLALNTYFNKIRNKAFGIAMTITGFGPIFIPQLVAVFLNSYGSQGCLMIISSLTLHIVAAACLLHPLKWHSYRIRDDYVQSNNNFKLDSIRNSIIDENMDKTELSINKLNSKIRPISSNTIWELSSEDEDDYLEYSNRKIVSLDHTIYAQSVYGFDTYPQLRIQRSESHDINNTNTIDRKSKSVEHVEDLSSTLEINNFKILKPKLRAMSLTSPELESIKPLKPKNKRWFESGSTSTVHLASSYKIFDEEQKNNKILKSIENSNLKVKSLSIPEISHSNIQSNGKLNEKNNEIIFLKSIKLKIIQFFDLDLLKDKIYVNIILGISLAIFAEINFSLLTPIIINEMGYETTEISVFMSTLATADIVIRFISPFIGDYFDQPPRIMYMYSLGMLIISRSCLLFVTNFSGLIIVGVILGISKGVRSVYMSLVVPSYVPIERLASASGIQMVCNCILLLCFGPLLGFIRDKSGSFLACIIFINFLSLFTLALWSMEYIYLAYTKINSKNVLLN